MTLGASDSRASSASSLASSRRTGFFGWRIAVVAFTAQLVMTAVTDVRVRPAVGLPADAPHPILTEPGMARVVEDMRVGTARLVGVADVSAAVGVDEMARRRLLEGIIELLGQNVGPTHKRT